MIKITTEAVDLNEVLKHVTTGANGAVNYFVGTVRNQNKGKEVTHLEFEAYTPMAIKELQKIIDRMMSQWDILAYEVIHRVGRVGIGEIAVVIAVATVHRGTSFRACEFVIDELKKTVPIWKKEHYTDGAVWVNATP